MDFRLSSEQDMLRDAARRYMTTKLDFEARQKNVADSTDDWAGFAEMGWLMLAVPDSAGGLGGRLEDLALVAEELGRGIALEPFVFGAVLPARLLEFCGATDAEGGLGRLAGGTERFAAALYEADRRYCLTGLDATARAHAGGYELNGEKQLVFAADKADWLIVAARTGDDPRSALLMVPAQAPGVSLKSYRTIDNLGVADILFDRVTLGPAALLASPDAAAPALDRAIDEATVLICADAVGCMMRAIEMTAEYLKIRKQFGQVLASFQALQHGIANLYIEANDARSAVYRAISLCQAGDDVVRRRAVSACKFKVLESARNVVGYAVHFHGGIGMTCEYPVGAYLSRMLVSEQVFGNGPYHFDRYCALGQDLRSDR